MRRCSLPKPGLVTFTAMCCAALSALAACSDDVLAPTIDCDDAVGGVFIELTPPGAGSTLDYTVTVGDSI